MENYIEYRLTGNNRRLKKDVVPYIFACQPSRGNLVPVIHLAFQKRRHQSKRQQQNHQLYIRFRETIWK